MPPRTNAIATKSCALSAPLVAAVCNFASSFMFYRWQARRESNPQPAVLETAALPIELLACGCSANYRFCLSGACAPFSKGVRLRGPPPKLLQDLRDDAGADGAATLTDGEPQTFFHRDRVDQLNRHFDVVARHHHLGVARQLDHSRDVRRAEVELRAIALEERRVTAALFLRQHVYLALEVRVRRDRTRLRQHLAALHFLALRATQKHKIGRAHV